MSVAPQDRFVQVLGPGRGNERAVEDAWRPFMAALAQPFGAQDEMTRQMLLSTSACAHPRPAREGPSPDEPLPDGLRWTRRDAVRRSVRARLHDGGPRYEAAYAAARATAVLLPNRAGLDLLAVDDALLWSMGVRAMTGGEARCLLGPWAVMLGLADADVRWSQFAWKPVAESLMSRFDPHWKVSVGERRRRSLPPVPAPRWPVTDAAGSTVSR